MDKYMNNKLKPIETVYRGVKFRSKLEAQWAVFFDLCGIDWEYEPEGFDLGDGVWYLPDFLLHNIIGRPFIDKDEDIPSDLWVEVKGVMSDEDAEKILRWVNLDRSNGYKTEHPTLVLGQLPFYEDYMGPGDDLSEWIEGYWFKRPHGELFYSYQTIDSDYWQCFIGVNQEGKPTLMEPSKSHRYRNNEDWKQTEKNLFYARNYRFDHRREVDYEN